LGRAVQNYRAQSRIGLGAVSIEESSIESIPSADTNTDSDSDTIDTGIVSRPDMSRLTVLGDIITGVRQGLL
jgi:hypothetical protein